MSSAAASCGASVSSSGTPGVASCSGVCSIDTSRACRAFLRAASSSSGKSGRAESSTPAEGPNATSKATQARALACSSSSGVTPAAGSNVPVASSSALPVSVAGKASCGIPSSSPSAPVVDSCAGVFSTDTSGASVGSLRAASGSSGQKGRGESSSVAAAPRATSRAAHAFAFACSSSSGVTPSATGRASAATAGSGAPMLSSSGGHPSSA
mmetsp:Transcript_44667/g.142369  ORF Transcript_44667/g.142369 Transcript_44667/m.142369 type:complete len:211 (+) Transcript_44667:657-1289(+)